MALPTKTKTWTHTVNIAVGSNSSAQADSRDFYYKLKNILVSQGAVLESSCDAVAFGNNDQIDRITGTSKLTWSYLGSRSWFVLVIGGINPKASLLFDCGLNGFGTEYGVKIRYCSTGFGTVNGGTNGSLSAAPTGIAGNSFYCWSSALSSDYLNPISSAFAWTIHVMSSSDKQCWRILCTDAGQLVSILMIETLKNPNAALTHPVVAMLAALAGSKNYFAGALAGSTPYAKLKQASTDVDIYFTGRNVASLTTMAASDFGSSLPAYPVGVYSQLASYRDWYYGELYDFWWAHYLPVTGDSYPSTGVLRRFMHIGGMLFPWNGASIDGTALDASPSATETLRDCSLIVMGAEAPVVIPPSPPTVTLLSTSALKRNTPISVSVTDNELKKCIVLALFGTNGSYEVVHDGDNFSARYASSARTAITGGYGYAIARVGGWPSAPTIKVVAFDDYGAESE
jgi:hypothetical protein